MNYRIYLLATLLILLVASCVSLEELAPPVDESFVSKSKISAPSEIESLKIGRHLYTARCGSCHSLDPVNAYNMKDWHRIMYEEKMAEKSKYTSEETKIVLNYIEKARNILNSKHPQ